jgi:hypothetical protein
MAYAQPRSANTELEQGMIDGSYKQVIKDRGGVVEQGTWYQRDDLSCVYYGIHEAPVMDTPDGKKMVSPYHTATPCPNAHDNHSLAGVMMYGSM